MTDRSFRFGLLLLVWVGLCPPTVWSAVPLDIDESSGTDPLTDGLLIIRYRSDRVPGRHDPTTLKIPLIGDDVPASLQRGCRLRGEDDPGAPTPGLMLTYRLEHVRSAQAKTASPPAEELS